MAEVAWGTLRPGLLNSGADLRHAFVVMPEGRLYGKQWLRSCWTLRLLSTFFRQSSSAANQGRGRPGGVSENRSILYKLMRRPPVNDHRGRSAWENRRCRRSGGKRAPAVDQAMIMPGHVSASLRCFGVQGFLWKTMWPPGRPTWP
jgi:hypothetical protein